MATEHRNAETVAAIGRSDCRTVYSRRERHWTLRTRSYRFIMDGH